MLADIGHHPRLLRLNEVLAIVPLSKSTLYALMSRGVFPKPVPLSARSRAWDSDEIARWLIALVDRERTGRGL